MSPAKRFRSWRARRRHFRHQRWLRRRKVLLPAPRPEACRPGPEAVCGILGAVLLAALAAPSAHAAGLVSLEEPSSLALMSLGVLGLALRVVSRHSAHRFRDDRMSRRHPGQLCNCKACVEAFPSS